MGTVIEEQTNEALLSLRDTGPESLVERIDGFIHSMADVVKQSEALVPAANEFVITTEAECAFADDMRVEMDSEAKRLDDRRLQLTRPIDDLKSYVVDQVKPAIANNKAASEVYKRKVLAYRAEERRKAEAARLEAERAQRETQARLEAEARRKEQEASKLKTDAARQRKQEEIDALRQAAAVTPVALTVAPAPTLTSSSAVNKWLWQVTNWPAFCKWLGEHPEWLNERGTNSIVIGPKQAAMNKLAGMITDSIEIPGLKIWSEEDLRKKASR